METIRVRWEGPYSVDGAYGVEEVDDWGLYKISRKWGGRKPEYVLYICMAYRGDFTSRPRDHE